MRFLISMGDALSMWAGRSARKNKNRTALLGVIVIVIMATTLVPAQIAQKTIVVDDDGAQCPSAAFSTIQAAVESASLGARILVCPGTYRGTVKLIGHGKDGLKIIAAGSQEEVVLQGDHMEPYGFHLEDVNEVLIQGFTIRDFGMGPTTSTVFGMGRNIALLRANKNLIRYNVVTRGDMMGIDLRDSSSDNVIEHNLAYNNDNFPNGAACGIMISGAGSARNIVRNNEAYGNDITGVMLQETGADNVVSNNTLYGNGTFGITVRNSNGTRIEGNRTQRQRGRFAGPNPNRYAIGIGVETSTGVVVKDNLVSDNPGFDILWDNRGEYTFGDNGRLRPLKRALLTNTTDSARNPNFLVGDRYRVEVSDAPANSRVYLRIAKDGNVLGTSGPYGNLTDAQGRWSLTGIFESSAVGSWLVQLVFGDPDAGAFRRSQSHNTKSGSMIDDDQETPLPQPRRAPTVSLPSKKQGIQRQTASGGGTADKFHGDFRNRKPGFFTQAAFALLIRGRGCRRRTFENTSSASKTLYGAAI